MPTNQFHQFCIIFALCAVLIGEAVASTPVTPNLLINGDAETQRCTDDWTKQTSVPGWRVTRGAASVPPIRRLWRTGCGGRKISGYQRAGTLFAGQAGSWLDFALAATYLTSATHTLRVRNLSFVKSDR